MPSPPVAWCPRTVAISALLGVHALVSRAYFRVVVLASGYLIPLACLIMCVSGCGNLWGCGAVGCRSGASLLTLLRRTPVHWCRARKLTRIREMLTARQAVERLRTGDDNGGVYDMLANDIANTTSGPAQASVRSLTTSRASDVTRTPCGELVVSPDFSRLVSPKVHPMSPWGNVAAQGQGRDPPRPGNLARVAGTASESLSGSSATVDSVASAEPQPPRSGRLPSIERAQQPVFTTPVTVATGFTDGAVASLAGSTVPGPAVESHSEAKPKPTPKRPPQDRSSRLGASDGGDAPVERVLSSADDRACVTIHEDAALSLAGTNKAVMVDIPVTRPLLSSTGMECVRHDIPPEQRGLMLASRSSWRRVARTHA